MEDKVKRQTSKDLLVLIGQGLVMTVAIFLAPQLLYVLLSVYLKNKFGKTYTPKQVGNAYRYLKRKKFIAHTNGKLVLTPLAKEELVKAEISNITLLRVESWDKYWRMVTFDIPEVLKASRHIFRRKLKELGFYHLERSVFVFPSECEFEISRLAEQLKIKAHVHYFVVRRFANDKDLIKFFKL